MAVMELRLGEIQKRRPGLVLPRLVDVTGSILERQELRNPLVWGALVTGHLANIDLPPQAHPAPEILDRLDVHSQHLCADLTYDNHGGLPHDTAMEYIEAATQTGIPDSSIIFLGSLRKQLRSEGHFAEVPVTDALGILCHAAIQGTLAPPNEIAA